MDTHVVKVEQHVAHMVHIDGERVVWHRQRDLRYRVVLAGGSGDASGIFGFKPRRIPKVNEVVGVGAGGPPIYPSESRGSAMPSVGRGSWVKGVPTSWDQLFRLYHDVKFAKVSIAM